MFYTWYLIGIRPFQQGILNWRAISLTRHRSCHCVAIIVTIQVRHGRAPRYQKWFYGGMIARHEGMKGRPFVAVFLVVIIIIGSRWDLWTSEDNVKCQEFRQTPIRQIGFHGDLEKGGTSLTGSRMLEWLSRQPFQGRHSPFVNVVCHGCLPFVKDKTIDTANESEQ